MPQYIMLFHFTEQGFTHLKDSPKRIEAAKKIITDASGKVLNVFAVLGRFDTVWIIEAPNDDVIASISLQLSANGSTRAETLRAFTEAEYLGIIKKLESA